MKRLIKILTLTLMLGASLTAFAVTKDEMDQARALAAKAYLRYANDGSGYLDQIAPKSMADLEKQLKAKEKENIKAFKDIAVPSGYESWTKEQLVEFWGKAFSSKGLVEKGRAGRTRAKKYISDMTISAPVKEVKKTEEKKDPAPYPAETPKEKAGTEIPVEAAPNKNAVDSMQATLEKAEAIVEEGIPAIEEDPQISKVKDHSLTYIIILIILVGAVIALVVFASNVMKRNAAAARKEDLVPSEGMPRPDDSEKIRELKENFSATLNAKNNEIAGLSKKLETLNAQNAGLKKNLEALTAEVGALRTRLAAATSALENAQAVVASAKAVTTPAAAPAAAQTQATPAPKEPQQATTPLRTIYLGKANSQGIFIRADRSLNAGKSVYRLDTADGFSGSFRVASDPSVWEMALTKPRDILAGGCVAADIENTAGMKRVVNDTAGTAIFEDGCWKVLRKAKIHYE